MAKKYDVVAVTGKYTNQNGEEKNQYENVGAVIQTQNGFSLKMKATFNPAGLAAIQQNQDGGIWLNLYEPKPKQAAQQQPQQQAQQPMGQQAPAPNTMNDLGDDIPFLYIGQETLVC